jgi:hypothetical protein
VGSATFWEQYEYYSQLDHNLVWDFARFVHWGNNEYLSRYNTVSVGIGLAKPIIVLLVSTESANSKKSGLKSWTSSRVWMAN